MLSDQCRYSVQALWCGAYQHRTSINIEITKSTAQILDLKMQLDETEQRACERHTNCKFFPLEK